MNCLLRHQNHKGDQRKRAGLTPNTDMEEELNLQQNFLIDRATDSDSSKTPTFEEANQGMMETSILTNMSDWVQEGAVRSLLLLARVHTGAGASLAALPHLLAALHHSSALHFGLLVSPSQLQGFGTMVYHTSLYTHARA